MCSLTEWQLVPGELSILSHIASSGISNPDLEASIENSCMCDRYESRRVYFTHITG